MTIPTIEHYVEYHYSHDIGADCLRIAVKQRSKDIAKELREFMDCRPEMTPDMRIHMKLLIAQLDGEKEAGR
jgi:hypothetical protein